MVVAVPPEPVAAFGNQDFFAGTGQPVGTDPRRGLERLPCLSQLAPRALIVSVADPDVQLRVAPRARENAGQFSARLVARFGHRHGPELGVLGQQPVERAEKWPAAAFEMLPGVLAVEDDGNPSRLLAQTRPHL